MILQSLPDWVMLPLWSIAITQTARKTILSSITLPMANTSQVRLNYGRKMLSKNVASKYNAFDCSARITWMSTVLYLASIVLCQSVDISFPFLMLYLLTDQTSLQWERLTILLSKQNRNSKSDKTFGKRDQI